MWRSRHCCLIEACQRRRAKTRPIHSLSASPARPPRPRDAAAQAEEESCRHIHWRAWPGCHALWARKKTCPIRCRWPRPGRRALVVRRRGPKKSSLISHVRCRQARPGRLPRTLGCARPSTAGASACVSAADSAVTSAATPGDIRWRRCNRLRRSPPPVSFVSQPVHSLPG
jgi:hypothetical protein